MKNTSIYILLMIAAWASACKKQNEWLNAKAQNRDVLPRSIVDYQAMLDHDGWMNLAGPGLGILGSDNYYVTYDVWQATNLLTERNGYLWNSDVFGGEVSSDWNRLYTRVAYANVALEGLQEIGPVAGEQEAWDHAYGNALFYRANAFFEIAQLFAPPYHAATAATDRGIVLKQTSDIHEKVHRSSIRETYDRIIADLLKAEQLLPAVPAYRTRPSRAVACALLARIYMHTGDYPDAEIFAGKALELDDELIDFNTLDSTLDLTFPGIPRNKEVLFYSETSTYSITRARDNRALIDTLLYRSYDQHDLRKVMLYTKPDAAGRVQFKGQYTGLNTYFGGIGTNELYLLKAEAAARNGNQEEALRVLNKLLETRWRSNTFIPFFADSPEEALAIVIAERRKELPFTGILRWEDLRRLNREPAFAQTLTRMLNNITYTLPPGDRRYTYPIPDNEILKSGIEQNER